MTRRELEREVARRVGISRDEGCEALGHVLGAIEDALCEGMRVELRGFGTLHSRHYGAYEGRNPATGAPVMVAAKVVPVFKPSKQLLTRLDQEEP